MHEQFARDIDNRDKSNTCKWMTKCDLKRWTKSLIYSANEQSIQTNYIKCDIDKSRVSPLCVICGTRNDTISCIVSECGRLAERSTNGGMIV